MKSRFLLSVAATLCLLPASCGEVPLPGPQPYPVHGKVVYKGQPAQGFRVAFYPLADIGRLRFAPAAVTDGKGEFTLRSYNTADGAPPGEYAVTFSWPQHINTGEEADPMPEVDQLRGAYSDPQKSKFKVTVREGENVFDPFVLQ